MVRAESVVAGVGVASVGNSSARLSSETVLLPVLAIKAVPVPSSIATPVGSSPL
jgi:hypothetical protein